MPEGGAVGDHMVESAADEDAIGQFCDLDGEKWEGVAVVVDGSIEREEGFDDAGDKARGQDVGRGYVRGGGMDELSSFVVAFDGDRERGRRGVVIDGGETAGEGIEVIEDEREGGYEAGNDGGGGFGKENALLDVIYGEQPEIPRREMD